MEAHQNNQNNHQNSFKAAMVATDVCRHVVFPSCTSNCVLVELAQKGRIKEGIMYYITATK